TNLRDARGFLLSSASRRAQLGRWARRFPRMTPCEHWNGPGLSSPQPQADFIPGHVHAGMKISALPAVWARIPRRMLVGGESGKNVAEPRVGRPIRRAPRQRGGERRGGEPQKGEELADRGGLLGRES